MRLKNVCVQRSANKNITTMKSAILGQDHGLHNPRGVVIHQREAETAAAALGHAIIEESVMIAGTEIEGGMMAEGGGGIVVGMVEVGKGNEVV